MAAEYWKRESLADGKILALFRIEDEKVGYYYKDGKWSEDESGDVIAKVMWEDDYNPISEAEAKECMKHLGGSNE